MNSEPPLSHLPEIRLRAAAVNDIVEDELGSMDDVWCCTATRRGLVVSISLGGKPPPTLCTDEKPLHEWQSDKVYLGAPKLLDGMLQGGVWRHWSIDVERLRQCHTMACGWEKPVYNKERGRGEMK